MQHIYRAGFWQSFLLTGDRLTTDGGSPLLRQVDRRIGLLRRLAKCFLDRRDPSRIEHSLAEMVSQRVYALALG